MMKLFPDVLLTLAVPSLILLHLYLSPHTKVEESFNLQATHDIITHGIPTQDFGSHLRAGYDHFSFPGAVPRTFAGALILAALSKPGIWLGLDPQHVVRGVLGLFNAFAILSFRNTVSRAFGRDAGNWYLAMQAGQFHIMYYASRTLPNMFAFGLSVLALREFLPVSPGSSGAASRSKRQRLAIYLLTLTGIIFRSEIVILLGAQILFLLVRQRISLTDVVIPAGLGGAFVGLLITVPLDSFFWWRFPLWPEFAGFYYNAVEGKSVDWGTSPWYFYFVNALPRLLMNPITWQLCMPLALGMDATRGPSLDILLPLMIFIGIYSIQPHKEWRFIVYAVPGLTTVAGLGANWIWTRRTKSVLYQFFSLVLVASTIGSFAASIGMLMISRLNYPGAEALDRVHQLADGSQNVIRLHMDTLSCTTGVTRFLETQVRYPSSAAAAYGTMWMYDKTEDPYKLLEPEFWDQFDYVLAEKPEEVIGKWEVVDEIKGFSGFTITGDVESGRQQMKPRNTTDETSMLLRLYGDLREFVTDKVTRGAWVELKMEPKIRIMRKLPETLERFT